MFNKEELEIIKALVNTEILEMEKIEKEKNIAFCFGNHLSIIEKVRKL